MIGRYTDDYLVALWADEAKLKRWMQVSQAWVNALEAYEYIDRTTRDHMLNQQTPSVIRHRAQEQLVRHDVAAFVDLLTSDAPTKEAANAWHLGLTSSNLVDTAESLLLASTARVFSSRLQEVYDWLKEVARSGAAGLCIGRTHGQAAAPYSYGLRYANWAKEVGRRIDDWEAILPRLERGKFGGPVGTYVLSPELELHACEELELLPDIDGSQIIGRDRIAQYLNLVALTGATIERIALQIRLLAQQEISELREYFHDNQKGSSSMPHKANPIRAERLTGLARVLRGYAVTGLEDVALWGERDISHSSAERIVLRDASLLLGWMLIEVRNVLMELQIALDRVHHNLQSAGVALISYQIYIDLLQTGMPRDEAYAASRNLMEHEGLVIVSPPEHAEYIIDQLKKQGLDREPTACYTGSCAHRGRCIGGALWQSTSSFSRPSVVRSMTSARMPCVIRSQSPRGSHGLPLAR